MPDGSILDRLFPAAPPHKSPQPLLKPTSGFATRPEFAEHKGGAARSDVSTRWAAVYTLELRGLTGKQIAEALNIKPNTVSQIVADPRYIEYRERHLSVLDQEFVAMKPLAFAALKNGLTSQDENTALRAADAWFKGANYGGYSKHERPPTTATAEDIARELMRGGVNIQVNTDGAPAQVNITHSDTEK